MLQLNFIFGLGIFLLGMSQLEYGIHRLSDARLRLLLRNSTRSRLGSVTTGIVTTAILQSSSMVSLLVLAFAAAGLLPLLNAVGIILGANLGTTITGWIVTLFGFKLDLEAMALPVLGLTAFVLAVAKRDSRLWFTATAVFGLALLLFGLGVMKASMEALPEQWDVSILQGHRPSVYLLFGVLLAALVQSSSAVMLMALAALNAQFIALPEAVALIIGADLGTTSTTVLGSITGSRIKRQLAFAHCSFNLVVDLAAFFLLLPIAPGVFSLLSLEDPLYSLVAFHSLINLLGLLAFLPFMDHFVHWIERIFSHGRLAATNALDRVPPVVVEAALVASRETVKMLLLQAACNSLRLFELKPDKLEAIDKALLPMLGTASFPNFAQGYEELKNQEGRVLEYAVKIQSQPLQAAEALELEQLQIITRHLVYANKNLKDIQQDLRALKYSSTRSMRELYERHKRFHRSVYEQIIGLLLDEYDATGILQRLHELQELNEQHTDQSNKFAQAIIGREVIDGTALSIQFNANREIHHALKTLLKALRLWLQTSGHH